MRKEIENWLKQAEADLKSALNCIKPGDYYLAVFACHQSAEKALKSLCLLKLKEIPKGIPILRYTLILSVPYSYLFKER